MNDTNKTEKKGKSGIRLLILAVAFALVIFLLVRCVRGCGGRHENLMGELTDTTLTHNAAQYTGYCYSGAETTYEKPDLTVASGVPGKRTKILGDGKDTATVMVYVCASDLESGGGAATMDIREMLDAGVGENVNLILYTGGTKEWQNRQMSNRVNQIYQIKGDSLYLLDDNAGNNNMADPATLAEFIHFCGKNFPANRNMLIFWDHGGGSVSGFGYDENYKHDSGMDLSEIRTALEDGGVDFDFVGFDACLMGTVETGLAISDHADYLIGSEEIESGYGWYYTDWLRLLSSKPSLSTVEIGKEIADDFVTYSTKSRRGQSATLSVTDLAELSYTVPDKLQSFAQSVTGLIENGSDEENYITVSGARSRARSFGVSGGVDQVDLIDFARRLGTAEGEALASAVQSAVKYNCTSSDMSGSYGLSVYFPYNSSKYIKPAEQVYNSIGITPEYTRCVQAYAAMELSGQYISGGSGSPFNSLYGIFGSGNYGDSTYYGNTTDSSYSSTSIYDMLGELMGGNLGGFSYEYEDSDFSFFRNNINLQNISEFLSKNQFDEKGLMWQENEAGQPVIMLSGEQWDLVDNICLNMFYDDGEGLIDLGSDNVLEFDKDGNLLGVNDRTWLTIDGHYISYYYDSMTADQDHYKITGHSLVLYNGKEADLILVFDDRTPGGYISGIRYREEGEQMIGKTLDGVISGEKADLDKDEKIRNVHVIKEGDQIEFLADAYDYQGNYLDRIVIGDAWVVGKGKPVIRNMDVGDGRVLAMYCFTDIYQKKYWTGVIPEAVQK